MIPVTESLPENKQNVLIDNGTDIFPAEYNKERGTFERYDNTIEGDRCYSFFYSGVISWMPFPKTQGRLGFKAEPEPPLPAKDISIPFSASELSTYKYSQNATLTTTPVDPNTITSVDMKTGEIRVEKKEDRLAQE